MLDIFNKILDLVAPPPPAVSYLRNVSPQDFTKELNQNTVGNVKVLSDYTKPRIKAAITANKFHDHKKAAALLGILLQEWLTTLPIKTTILIPVPLSAKRQKDRGYNQVLRIIKEVKSDSVTIAELLVRQKETVPQTSLKRSERLTNMIDVFKFSSSQQNFSGQRLILVDDVITTGSTLDSARKALEANLPEDCELICIAIAH